ASLTFTWTPPADDGGGVAGYSIEVGQAPNPIPNETMDIGNAAIYKTAALLPGVYYIGLRAVDYSGHWGPTANGGPYIVEVPWNPDLTPYQPAGWASPYVIRQSADATSSNVPAPTTLLGYAPTYSNEAWANIGTGNVAGTIRNYQMVNGAWSGAWVQPNNTLQPGYYFTFINHFLNTSFVPGGVHTLAPLLDGAEI